jgi:hypothetical protein
VYVNFWLQLYIYIPDSDIAHYNISILFNSFIFILGICICCFALFGITALLELGTAFRYTRDNICKTCVCDQYNLIWFYPFDHNCVIFALVPTSTICKHIEHWELLRIALIDKVNIVVEWCALDTHPLLICYSCCWAGVESSILSIWLLFLLYCLYFWCDLMSTWNCSFSWQRIG